MEGCMVGYPADPEDIDTVIIRDTDNNKGKGKNRCKTIDGQTDEQKVKTIDGQADEQQIKTSNRWTPVDEQKMDNQMNKRWKQ